MSEGYDVDYDAENHQLAITVSESSIVVNGRFIDLTGRIEGNIQHIEWMPSLFYHN